MELSLKDAKQRISIAKTLGKLDESELPAVLWNDKKALIAEEMRYLFYRQKTVETFWKDSHSQFLNNYR
ncbi:hypothetical protein [Leptospira mayottensis]|uniref:Uncharacterized protein n=2 Tax=Leptospira mayottensis TaxID=1137606 RepID=A0AA87SYD7_9LEPT|nr:hypothetical protein [Leptospira mayottensis]AXR62529.1 hypothetical protein DQM68_15960 [Leptospira mayottensis]AXR66262.1 hypothetical protein DQM28_18295 [Leptospira mayottensis]AZQ03717.1 hypothetical protein LEP1GSC190_05765 [Leptospira mayottensis 200901116]EKS01745.1 hypothetical protein LEP1GSC125_4044 [Leptospira mayottensis 200901122]TGM95388.1 hypothetical protein EHR03_16620 [Leptospira mayottensis]